MKLQDKTAVVTGGTGLLGVHLVAELLDRGCRVRVLMRDASGAERLRQGLSRLGADGSFETVECVVVPLNNPVRLRDAVAGAGVLFHCAAEVSYDPSRSGELIAVNTEIASHVAGACLECGVERMLHVSSIATLGNAPSGRMITEDCVLTSLEGRSAYSVSKFYAENAVRRAGVQGLDVVIVNPAIILGEGDWGRGSARLVAVAAGGSIVATSGVKGYVDVKDVARALALLAECDRAAGERFILSAGNLSFRELFTMAASAAGRPRPLLRVGAGTLRLAVKVGRMWCRRRIGAFADDAFVANATDRSYYDGGKIRRFVAFDYTPLDETVRRVVGQYLKDRKS